MFDLSKITFRNFQGEADLPLLIRVRESCVEEDQIDISSTLESIPTINELKESFLKDNCDPYKDVLVIVHEEKVIGYARVCWWIENDGTAVFLHVEYLVPKFRSNDLWQSILNWVEQRIKIIANELGAEKKVYGANASTTEGDKTKILIDNNYLKVFSLVEMSLDTSDLVTESISIPRGFILKEVKQNDLRLIWEANNLVYQHRDFISRPTEDYFQYFVNNPNNDFSLWKVAYQEEGIAGFAIGSIKNQNGEIDEASVLPEYRRKSLAHYLLVQVLQELEKKGINQVYLHTNGENVSGALSLYEKVGFKYKKNFVKYRKTF
jgi:ribosomal protein S18 acetylase RimI-like enzyme